MYVLPVVKRGRRSPVVGVAHIKQFVTISFQHNTIRDIAMHAHTHHGRVGPVVWSTNLIALEAHFKASFGAKRLQD